MFEVSINYNNYSIMRIKNNLMTINSRVETNYSYSLSKNYIISLCTITIITLTYFLKCNHYYRLINKGTRQKIHWRVISIVLSTTLGLFSSLTLLIRFYWTHINIYFAAADGGPLCRVCIIIYLSLWNDCNNVIIIIRVYQLTSR